MSKRTSGGYGTPKLFTWDVAQGLPLLLQAGDANYVYGPGGMLLAQHTFGTIDPQAPGGSQPTKAAEPTQPDQPDSEFGPYYYLADQSGNIIMMVHGSGLIEARYSCDAYGNRTDDPDNLWPYNPFGYAGQYTDQESGLVYMRARYYDPATEQFISRDPMEGVSGQPYVYAGASPLNATDVSGRFLDTLFDIAAIGMDVKDIADNGLSWENGLMLVADVGLALVPFAPAVGGAALRGGKALAHADDAVSVSGLLAHADKARLADIRGVPIAGRPSVDELVEITDKYNIEFAVTYKYGPGKNGGGGTYYLHAGEHLTVSFPAEANRMLIYHTHPRGALTSASGMDMTAMRALASRGSPQRSSVIVPVEGAPFRFGIGR